ncbi:MAG: glycosyltransferase family 2 protein [Candidatus Cryptobacteroides sp.]
MTKVSVIIPIYKVEPFIGRCAISLMEQTLHDVEYIFVNDATPDDSMKVLESVIACYPERHAFIKILNHEGNKGLPAARNTGLAEATGKYVFHCDSDDFVERTMLEELYDTAQRTDADIVWCDWLLSFETSDRYMKQPYYGTPMEALKAMLGGAMKFNVWNKLVKRSLYIDNGVLFPAGYGMGEDMTMMLLFAYAKRVAYLPKAFYHYVKLNTNAFSQTYSERHLEELRHNVQNTEARLNILYGDALKQEISFLKLEAKFPFLLSSDKRKQQLWREWYPEANEYILKNHNISIRSRAIQWCAWKRLDFIVSLYQWFLNKLVYGIIYK